MNKDTTKSSHSWALSSSQSPKPPKGEEGNELGEQMKHSSCHDFCLTEGSTFITIKTNTGSSKTSESEEEEGGKSNGETSGSSSESPSSKEGRKSNWLQ